MAKAGANLEPRAMCEAKAEHAAEAGEGAKVVLVAGVKQEAKAGPAVAVGATAEAKRVMYAARAESGDQSHEVAAVKRVTAKRKKERGAPAVAATAVLEAGRI